MNSLSISIPAYNEEFTIEQVVRECCEAGKSICPDIEILVINDGSRDNTQNILLKLQQEGLPVTINLHPENLGFGPTLKEVFTGPGKEWVFMISSDGQINPQELFKLIPYTKEFDYILGWRKNRQDNLFRKFAAYSYSLLISMIARKRVHDVDSVVLVRRNSIPESFIANSAFVHAEIFLNAVKNNKNIIEIPIAHNSRLHGKASGVKFKVVIKVFYDLFRYIIK